jgi:glycolate oxidase iron-sulfur subunit
MLVPLAEATTCCGSAGIYNVTQPTTARQLLARKMQNVARTGASLLVTANPGCHAWMDQGARDASSASGPPIEVRHLAEVLEAAFQSPLDAPWRTTEGPVT